MSADTDQQLSVACLRDASADMCRTRSCHSRVHVREVITRNGSVTLCRHCRKQYFGVSS